MLKLDPKNTELLAQKQIVLRQNIEQTTSKLKELKNAQDLYIKSGGDLNSAEYRNLQREIIATENQLKQLKIEASNWTQASQNLSELSQKMKSLGDTITNIGKKVSVLSTAIGGLFVAGTKYNADIEKYTTAFKTFLGSAEEAEEAVRKIKEESANSPFDTKDLIQANQMLITTGESAEDSRKTISALSDAIALTGGSNDTLSRMASNLQQIKNVGKASSMDIKQFGMAGIDIYGVLADYTGKTTAEVKKMDVTYEDLSKALQAAASEGGKYFGGQAEMSETLSGKVSKIKKSFQDLLGQLSESLFPVIKKFADKLQGLVDWFRNLDDGTKQTITKIGLFITALGPALVIIGKLISFGGAIAGGLSKIAGIIAKVMVNAGGLKGVLAALTGPIGIVIGVITALTAAFIYLYNTNEDFRNKANETWQNIINLFQEHVMPVIENLRNLFETVINSIMEIIQKLWEYIEPVFNTMLTWLMDFWNNTLSDIVANVLDFVNELITLATIIWEKFISPIANFLIDTLGPVFQKVFNFIWGIVSWAFEKIGIVVKSITGVFKGLIEFVTGVFAGDWDKAWQGVKDAFGSAFEGMKGLFKTPINWIIDKLNQFIRGVNKIQVPDWVPGVGGKGINIPQIPKLAKGGIIDKATLALIGEGKSAEAVIPLDRTLTKYMAQALKEVGGNNKITINFYPQKMTEAELDNAVNYINKRFGLAY